MTVVYLLAVAACLTALAMHAMRRGGLLMALVVAQVLYWSISYIGRPLVCSLSLRPRARTTLSPTPGSSRPARTPTAWMRCCP
jgi:hypothetical protein